MFRPSHELSPTEWVFESRILVASSWEGQNISRNFKKGQNKFQNAAQDVILFADPNPKLQIRSMHASPKFNAIDRNRRALPCTVLSQSQTKGAFFCVPTEPV
jgi:hypothetical protein